MSESSTNPADESIVFFDGVCGLCSHTIDLLLRLDSRGQLKFAPLQGETASGFVPENVRKDLNTFVFRSNRKLHYRSAAVVRILWKIGGFWKIAGGCIWIVPSPLRDVCYRMVSKVRYRIFGKHDTCRLPTIEERKRFLD